MPSFKDLDDDARPDTPEDIEIIMVDTNREKEILGKAITGVLLLMLKWFRASRTRPLPSLLIPLCVFLLRTEIKMF